MARGGKRPGAGRPVGKATAKTREIAEAALEAQLSPLEVMLKFMADAAAKGDAERAVKYAALAAPYCHPRLSATAIPPKAPGHEVEAEPNFSKFSDDELRQYIALHEKALSLQH